MCKGTKVEEGKRFNKVRDFATRCIVFSLDIGLHCFGGVLVRVSS